MKTNMMTRILAAAAAFCVCYFAVGFFQPEKQRAAALRAVCENTSSSVWDANYTCQRVADTASDPDLKFLAQYAATVFSTLDDYGYKSICEVRNTSGVGALGKGLLAGYFHPLSVLKGGVKTVCLLWNVSKAERAEQAVVASYCRSVAVALGLSLAAAATTFVMMSRRSRDFRQPRENAQPVPA